MGSGSLSVVPSRLSSNSKTYQKLILLTEDAESTLLPGGRFSPSSHTRLGIWNRGKKCHILLVLSKHGAGC